MPESDAPLVLEEVDEDLVRSNPAQALGNTMLAHAIEERRQAHEEAEGLARTQGSNYPRLTQVEHEDLGDQEGDEQLRATTPGVVRELNTATVSVKQFDPQSRQTTAPTPDERDQWEAQQNAVLQAAGETSGGQPLPTGGNGDGDEGANASPAARELAAAENVDLADVQGTGTDGKITKADVEDHIDQR